MWLTCVTNTRPTHRGTHTHAPLDTHGILVHSVTFTQANIHQRVYAPIVVFLIHTLCVSVYVCIFPSSATAIVVVVSATFFTFNALCVLCVNVVFHIRIVRENISIIHCTAPLLCE